MQYAKSTHLPVRMNMISAFFANTQILGGCALQPLDDIAPVVLRVGRVLGYARPADRGIFGIMVAT